MTTTETPAFLTVEETAAYLRVSRPTVYRRIADGTLPAVRIGDGFGPLRVPTRELAHELSRALTPRGPALEPGTPSGAVEARAHAGTQGDGERSNG